jgi:hypothetical protein
MSAGKYENQWRGESELKMGLLQLSSRHGIFAGSKKGVVDDQKK